MGRPKQLLLVKGKAVLLRSVQAFKKTPRVGQIIVVTPAEVFAKLDAQAKGLTHALPGETRLMSVQNGVNAACGKYKLIAVHDGARPLVTPAIIEAGLKAAAKHKAAVLAVPVKDTVKEAARGFVARTLDRAVLWAAQTPQCYDAATLKKALKKYGGLKNATDESQLVEKLGIKVALVPSDYKNLKVTTPEDLITAEALCVK
jgi:2-C-methyl-D-erythritol 4-phosphate cytidylyltransferase